MIRVYDETEKRFNHNGIKALQPLFAEITKEDNGDYYIELEDILDNMEFYQKGLIVTVPTPWGVQGFRCDNPEISSNRITCKAWHLSYDAKNYLIKDSNAVNKNCNDALNHFNDATDITSPFTVSSDISTPVSTRAIRLSLFDIFTKFIGADKYGGHWDRNNFNFAIKEKIGQDRGVVLSYAKNITDIKVTEDWDSVCTKLLPYTTDGEKAIQLDEVYVELSEKLYDIPYSKVVKFENIYNKDDFETEESFTEATKQWLEGQARAYIEENKLPKVNYTVSASIDNVSDVGDLIHVKHPKCKVNITTNVISVKYDAIRGKYTEIEFGNFKKKIQNIKREIASEIGQETDEKLSENKALLQEELKNATDKINSAMSNSNVIYNGNEIIVVDRLPKEQAVYCIKINSAGIGFSNTGIQGTFNSAWQIDGTLNMQAINVINLTASLIKGGTLKLGGTNNASGTFELYDGANALVALMDKTGLTVYATNGDYVKLNATDGFAGFDKQGNKIYWADGDTFRMKNAEVENEIQLAGKIKIVPVSTDKNVGVGFVALA